MSKASRVGMQDVRAVFRLLGDVRDLRREPAAWQRRAIEGLCGMLGARQGSCLYVEQFRPGGALALRGARHAGWPNAVVSAVWESQIDGAADLSGDVQLARAVQLPGDVVSVLREQLVSDAEYYDSELVQALMPVTESDGHLSAWCRVGGDDGVIALTFHRDWHGRPATVRQRNVLQLFMEEFRILWSEGKLAAVDTPAGVAAPRLSRRERQVLDGLGNGDSVKQVAARLGLSPRTVEGHVKSLHRKFGVSSRGELLARFFRGAGGVAG
jgi:DNA-binding CsgD family transcriptional regulator